MAHLLLAQLLEAHRVEELEVERLAMPGLAHLREICGRYARDIGEI